ncbi:MAG TPA: sulfurtransferase [Desulfuromonadales bacterium]|nr:sulfurtransferase [Desulfuromonadales bacterium]
MIKECVRRGLVAVAAMILSFTAAGAQELHYKGFSRGSALITVQELKQLIDAKDPKLVVLASENNVEYFLGHIPGSHQIDRPAIEAPAASQGGITGNIVSAADFTRLAQRLGIDQDSKIVVYDSQYDATRLWWALTYYGKANVRVLDGGIKAWRSAGYTVDLLAPPLPIRNGTFVAKVAVPSLRVDTSDIIAVQKNHLGQIWDNRSIKEFTGEELKKGASRPGRIPGSLHNDWAQFKTKENKAEWRSANEIKALISTLGYEKNKDHYFYCQSGVRSTQALFALYLTGWPLEKIHNYDSSWIGWSRDTNLPLESGIVSGASTKLVK